MRLAARAPTPLHGRHVGPPRGPDRSGTLPRVPDGSRRPVHLSRARTEGRLRDAGPHATAAGSPRLRGGARILAHRRPGPVQRARGEAGGPGRGLGAPTRTGRRGGGQDRRAGDPGAPLRHLPRHQPQRRAGPVAFRRDRALRPAPLRRHQPRRSRTSGDDGGCRRGVASFEDVFGPTVGAEAETVSGRPAEARPLSSG